MNFNRFYIAINKVLKIVVRKGALKQFDAMDTQKR